MSLTLFAKSESAWHKQLEEERTERAFLGKYVRTKTPGVYHCVLCEAPLFSSEDKYQIGCGWPTFTKPVAPRSVYYLEDLRMGFKRYAVLCRSCDGRLGHVFNDGPPPKGLRYTIQSAALQLREIQ